MPLTSRKNLSSEQGANFGGDILGYQVNYRQSSNAIFLMFLECQVHLNSLAFALSFLLPKMLFLRSPSALGTLVWNPPREERLWPKPMFPHTYLVVVNGTELPNNKLKKEGKGREGKGKEGKGREREGKEGKDKK